jgi:hypothetical protein
MEFNGLALEYQRYYGAAHGDLNVFDLVNNPAANGKCRVLCLSFSKESSDLVVRDVGTLRDNRANPFVIAQYSV